MNIEAALQESIVLFNNGKHSEAASLLRAVLIYSPNHPEINFKLGLLEFQQNNFNTALSFFELSLATVPNNPVYKQFIEITKEKISETIDTSKKQKKQLEKLFNQKKYVEAVTCAKEALSIDPKDAYSWKILGTIEGVMQNYETAILYLIKSLEFDPKDAETHSNLANVLRILQRFEESEMSCYEAIRLQPDLSEAYNNLGSTLKQQKRLDEAEKNFRESIRLDAENAIADYNLAETLSVKGECEEAVKYYHDAIRLHPEFAEAYLGLGNTLSQMRKFEDAVMFYEIALELKPNFVFLLGMKTYAQTHMCDWSSLEMDLVALENGIRDRQKISAPFPILGLFDNPELQKICAQIYTENQYGNVNTYENGSNPSANKKIRIGYYSADFYAHATSYLMAELFESHNSEKFEIYGFSFGPNNHDVMNKRVSRAFTKFYDVSSMSDQDVVQLSRDLKIHIGVDLKGYTANLRTNIFALRCAPIQLNYLGYPGTMGAPFIDYIVADKIVIPYDMQSNYTEKIIYMPDSYQVNDSSRKISEKIYTRKELGLPEEGFVFCCFNNNYKIQPQTFDIWMRILARVEGSILWLYESNSNVIENLRKEALIRGIDVNRLVFAKKLPLDEHLARHSVADLFLDTLPYNAHTTASDSLWAGLPVLTCMGKSFASRVAASLLRAVDLPELITETYEDYEKVAIELAKKPEKLNELKSRLAHNRLKSSLFDGKVFAKNLEKAYEMVYERYHAGLKPDNIFV